MHAKQDERASVREARQQRRYGRLAALLFGAGSLATLPAGLLLEPVPGTELLIVTLMGMASAVACWFTVGAPAELEPRRRDGRTHAGGPRRLPSHR